MAGVKADGTDLTDVTVDDPGVFADLSDSLEVVVFEQFDGCAVEEAALCFASGGDFWDCFDEPAAEGTPVVHLRGHNGSTVAFFGPVINQAPRGDAACQLWDGVMAWLTRRSFSNSIAPITSHSRSTKDDHDRLHLHHRRHPLPAECRTTRHLPDLCR